MAYRWVIYILIFCPLFSLSQQTKQDNRIEEDYQKFSESLEKEVSHTDQNSTAFKNQVLHPANLPEWFFSFPMSDQQTIYAIGISEPGMEEKSARQLAVLRAYSIITLLVETSIGIMADNYLNEISTDLERGFETKYANFYEIFARMPFDTLNCEIINEYFTSFNEFIVMVKYETGHISCKDSLVTVANVYQVERQKDNQFEMQEKYEISGNMIRIDQTEKYDYKIHAHNNLFEITSYFNDILEPFPYMNFKYTSDNRSSFAFNYNSKLNYGLWKSFVEVFLQEYYFLAQDPDINIKQVGDTHSSSTQNLSREISKTITSVRIKKINIQNNRISVQLDYLN